MDSAPRASRIQTEPGVSDPCSGRVYFSPIKSLWITSMYIGAFAGAVFAFSWSGMVLFFVTSAVTLCAGHSVGMHRRLIHNSFDCPLWLEYVLAHLGSLVGLAGPFSIIQMHEFRDWAQRQDHCHDYFASRRNLLIDHFWILHCTIALDHPPLIRLEERLAGDRMHQFLEQTWMLQQLPWAVLFYGIGGWSWLLWGICMRVSVCMTGHWLVGYCAHRWGHRDWNVEGAGVQGYNVPFCGLITMGEAWHNNHHAFPDSARFGIFPHQTDPGWWLIQLFEKLGLAWNIKLPKDLPSRPELQQLIEQPEMLAH
jgi:fatty-acid desaturase